MNYFVELVWNREFTWVRYGRGFDTLEEAKKAAARYLDMGDGASVKKSRVVDAEGNVV